MEDVKPTEAQLRRSSRKTRSIAVLEQAAISHEQFDAPVTPKRIKLEPDFAPPGSEVAVERMLVSSTVDSPSVGPSRRASYLELRHVKVEVASTLVAVKQEQLEISGSSRGRGNEHAVVKEETMEAGPSRLNVKTEDSTSLVKLEPEPGSSDLEKTDSGKGKGKEKEKKPRVKKEVVPKRPMRWRKQCPVATRERLDRVMSQRMFLLDRTPRAPGSKSEQFKILGSTGNVYTVHVGMCPMCDCPDAAKGNIPCKHIIFVFMKVLKLAPSSELWYQRYLTDEELDTIFATAPPAIQGSSEVPARARAAWLKASGQEHLIPEADREADSTTSQVKAKEKEKEADPAKSHRKEAVGEDCPVCYEEMSAEDVDRGLLVWDDGLYGCGRALHSECFRNWSKSLVAREGAGAAITCVFCRGAWPTASAPVGGASTSTSTAGVGYTSNGYLNIADLVGVSRKRDTSSYYWGPMRGIRMGDPRYEDA